MWSLQIVEKSPNLPTFVDKISVANRSECWNEQWMVKNTSVASLVKKKYIYSSLSQPSFRIFKNILCYTHKTISSNTLLGMVGIKNNVGWWLCIVWSQDHAYIGLSYIAHCAARTSRYFFHMMWAIGWTIVAALDGTCCDWTGP